MKQWEIIRMAQEEGVKIRKSIWTKIKWIKWENRKWIGDCGGYASILLDEHPFELYIEHIKTFGPDRAMYWLERGYRIKRKLWNAPFYVSKNGATHVKFETHSSEKGSWFHNDWHLCDSVGNYVPEPEEGA
jgi:hypothetical protein